MTRQTLRPRQAKLDALADIQADLDNVCQRLEDFDLPIGMGDQDKLAKIWSSLSQCNKKFLDWLEEARV